MNHIFFLDFFIIIIVSTCLRFHSVCVSRMFISFVSSAFECGIYFEISQTGRKTLFFSVECVDVDVVSVSFLFSVGIFNSSLFVFNNGI